MMSEIKLDFQPSGLYSTRGILAVYGENDAVPLMCDTFDLANDRRRAAFVKKLVQEHKGIPTEKTNSAILAEVAKIMAEKRRAAEKAKDDQDIDPLEATPRETEEAALDLLRSQRLFGQISDDIAAIGIAGEEQLRVLLYVIMTSRLLDRPLSAIVQGASASGKSYIIEKVAKLIPPEAIVQAHDFTDQALITCRAVRWSIKLSFLVSGPTNTGRKTELPKIIRRRFGRW